MIYRSILDTVGGTPVVQLSKIEKLTGFDILVKLESFNPGGSIKDRAALSMITQASRTAGSSRPGRSSSPHPATWGRPSLSSGPPGVTAW
jgi:cysteine synthase